MEMKMPRKKVKNSKREKVFDLISHAIDLIKDKWKSFLQLLIFTAGVSLFIYVVFFWIDTVERINFEIIYIS
jgi:cell division septal protein FtsQ